MAELRRAGGSMEPHRQLGYRKILLPFEQELCQQLSISEEEYFEFLKYTSSLNGNRPREYDNIPYIVNMPQALGLIAAGGGLTTFGQIVVGVILTAVSYFLTPKPKPPKASGAASLTTPGQQGVRRFAPQTGFDSVQELAELGAVIPLVFAKYQVLDSVQDNDQTKHGGIRVNTQLLWSQMRSLGKGQQIKGIFNLSSGQLGDRPDFNGFAIGDVLLKNYSEGKFRLFWYDGGENGDGRFKNSTHKYPQGTLEIERDRNGNIRSDDIALPLVDNDRTQGFVDDTFCGTRTPSTQNVFGAYNPVPNSMRFMLPYELVIKQDNLEGDIEKKTVIKREKIQTNFPRYQAIVDVNGNTSTGTFNVTKDNLVTYQIANFDPNNEFDFSDWGSEDVASSINSDRENTDDTLAIGEQYLIGTAKGILISSEVEGKDNIWEKGKTKQFTFKITEPGKVQVKSVKGAHNPFETLLIQKCAIGIVTNSYKCDATEIGIKSVVNKQITSFTNVNSHPGYWQYYGAPDNAGIDGVVHDYEKKNGNISLGQLSKYVKRFSFFKLYARTVGENDWKLISTNIFAVLGRTPQPQYNFIRVTHSEAELREFKLEPCPGNKVKEQVSTSDSVNINLLTGSTLVSTGEIIEGYGVFFNGKSDYRLTANRASNSEWFLGEIPLEDEVGGGKVLAFNQNAVGTVPMKDVLEMVDGYPKRIRTKRAYYFVDFEDEDSDDLTYYDGGRVPLDRTESSTLVKNGFTYKRGTQQFDEEDDRFFGPFSIEKYRTITIEEDQVTGYPKTISPSGGQGSGLQVKIELWPTGEKRWSITSQGTNYKEGDKVDLVFPGVETIQVTCTVDTGAFVTEPWPQGQNLNPFDAIADFIKFDAERPSHLDQPEHQITYVNEFVYNQQMKYTRLSNVGLKMNSSKEFQNFSQLSVYVKNGIKVKNLINGTTESSSLFPNIAFHLLTDKTNGAGNLIGSSQINELDMTKAAKFCQEEKLFWDGVVTQKQNIREFIYQNAAFCLLDFTIKGGQFSLVPTLPTKDDFSIDYEVKGKNLVKALFTDGNTRNLKVSFLSPEERQLFQARIIFREEVENGFAKTKVIDKRFRKEFGGSDNDPREVFDMSNFCTSGDHATLFACYALAVRKFVDHGISFETIPDSAMSLEPGDYIRVFSEVTHNDRFENGYISGDGVIQSQGSSNPVGQRIFYWKAFNDDGSEFGDPRDATLTADTNGLASSQFRNAVFTIEKTESLDRIYRVESITYTEEGFVSVTGTHQPVKGNEDGSSRSGTLKVLDVMSNSTTFFT